MCFKFQQDKIFVGYNTLNLDNKICALLNLYAFIFVVFTQDTWAKIHKISVCMFVTECMYYQKYLI